MRMSVRRTAQLGELVAAAFDAAALSSTDPQKVSRLATLAVMDMLRRARHGAPRRKMSCPS